MHLDNNALAQFKSQLTRLETEALDETFEDIQYAELIPVNTTGPEWVKGVTYRSLDRIGEAKWINQGGQDVPNADILSQEVNNMVELAAIGYSYTLEEVSQSVLHNFPLERSRISAARRAAEEFIDDVALNGDADKGMTGLYNNGSIAPFAAAQTFETATLEQALTMVNNGLIGVGGEQARARYPRDTVILPTSSLSALANKIVPDTAQTFLNYIKTNNIYTARSGKELMVRDVNSLETAGAGDSKRAVFYRRDPNVLTFHMPMPHKFLPVQQVIMEFKVPGIFRIGGTEIRRPDAVGYQDGV